MLNVWPEMLTYFSCFDQSTSINVTDRQTDRQMDGEERDGAPFHLALSQRHAAITCDLFVFFSADTG